MIRSTMSILLVEDNPDDVELTLFALEKNNIANPVVVIRNGQEQVKSGESSFTKFAEL